jgi:hypothetical protein
VSHIWVRYAAAPLANVADVTVDAPLVYDGSVGDQTTYYQQVSPGGGTPASLTLIYDLGSAQQVGRARWTWFLQSDGSLSFMASNDGATWTSAVVGPPGSSPFGPTWEIFTTTNLTTTAFRYWRLAVSDEEAVRVADFRLYDASGAQFLVHEDGLNVTAAVGLSTSDAALLAPSLSVGSKVLAAALAASGGTSQPAVSATAVSARPRPIKVINQPNTRWFTQF